MSEADPVCGADGGSTVNLIALTLTSSQTFGRTPHEGAAMVCPSPRIRWRAMR